MRHVPYLSRCRSRRNSAGTSGRRFLSRHVRLRPRSQAGRIQPIVSRAVSIGLIFSLLATSAPSAPRMIADLVTEHYVSAAFWLKVDGWLKTLALSLKGQKRQEPKPQEEQEARDARVSRIQIYPGHTRVHKHQRAYLSAIAFDSNGSPVGGVAFSWAVDGPGLEKGRVQIDQNGVFEAEDAGTYKVRAEGAGKQAEIIITVAASISGAAMKSVPKGVGPVQGAKSEPSRSSVLSPSGNSRATRTHHRGGRNGSSMLVSPALPIDNDDPFGWHPGNFPAATDPINDRGNPPGRSPEGNGNFQFDIPLLQLTGRGHDLKLNLSYNSRLWTKHGSQITFDIDKDWPAPGWSLNLGKMINTGRLRTIHHRGRWDTT